MFSIVIDIFFLVISIIIPFIFSKYDLGRGGNIISIVTIILAVAVIASSCISTVPTGHTGILTTFGRVEDSNLPEGVNFHAPWQKVITMTNKEQTFTETNMCFLRTCRKSPMPTL